MCTGLTLRHVAPRRPAWYGESSALSAELALAWTGIRAAIQRPALPPVLPLLMYQLAPTFGAPQERLAELEGERETAASLWRKAIDSDPDHALSLFLVCAYAFQGSLDLIRSRVVVRSATVLDQRLALAVHNAVIRLAVGSRHPGDGPQPVRDLVLSEVPLRAQILK